MMEREDDRFRDGRKIQKSEEEWRARLTPEQFRITRRGGTERPFTGPHLDEKRAGSYHCVCCGALLFTSQDKFDSGTGWPSFTRPATGDAVSEHEDRGLLMRRTEIRCARCEAHLGHVFGDGPAPGGLRYCMNGTALDFRAGDENGTTP